MTVIKKILALNLMLLSTYAYATNGIFTSLETGLSKQTGLPPASSGDATGLVNHLTFSTWRAAVGYNHDILNWLGFGVNVGLGKYGDSVYSYADADATTVRSYTLEILAQISTHFQHWDLIGKVGGARENSRVTGTNAQEINHYNNPAMAFEAAYNFTPRMAGTLSYGHVFGGNPTKISQIANYSVPLDAYLIGLRYTFAGN
jgi:hypothetical protein